MSFQGVARRSWSDVQVALFLFLALWVTYGFIGPGYGAENSNAVTRMGLLYSILDRHSLGLGDFAAFTIDKALFQGTYFADKAPGLTFTALPVTAMFIEAARALHLASPPIVGGELSRFFAVSVAVASLFTSSLFTAAAATALYGLARHWRASRAAALYGALCFALATPAAGWATAFFGHAMAGACLFLAFTTIILATDMRGVPGRDLPVGLLAGALLGWAVVVEYTAAPAALVLGVFGLWRLGLLPAGRRWRLLGGAVAGGVLAALPLAVYNELAFGSALHVGYENVTGFDGMKQGFLGISLPSPRVLWELIFGTYRGILWVAPVLILAPLGYWAAFQRLPRSVAVALVLVPACYLWINSGYYYWDGGFSTGPRHITPSLAFVCLALVPLWDAAGRAGRAAFLAIGVLSGFVSLVCASVDMTSPPEFSAPLFQHLFPNFRVC